MMSLSSRNEITPLEVQIANTLQFIKSDHTQEEIAEFLSKVKSALNADDVFHRSEYHQFIERVIGNAMFANQLEVVKCLLDDENGRDIRYHVILDDQPTERHESKYSLMEAAVLSGSLAMTKLVYGKLELYPHEYPHKEFIRKTKYEGMRLAVRTGNIEIVNYLLSKGIKIDNIVDEHAYKKDTLIAHAAEHDRLQLLDALMQHATFYSLPYAIGHMSDKYIDAISNLSRALGYYTDEKRQEIIAKIAAGDDKRSEYEAELSTFDTKKLSHTANLKKTEATLEKITQALLDHGVGIDFSDTDLVSLLHILKSLKSLNGLNFIGVSINGHPVTHEILKSYHLPDADDALVTLDDIYKIQDPVRREALQQRIHHEMDLHGRIINDSIVNLVPLYKAVEIGNIEVVTARLANKAADPDESYDAYRVTKRPLMIAVSNNREDIVTAIINHPNFDIRMLDEAAKAAKSAGHTKLAEMLAKKHEEEVVFIANINKLDKNGRSPLHRAVHTGNFLEVQRLIKLGADVNLVGSKGSPLYEAASYSPDADSKLSDDDIAIMQYLLTHGANPDQKYYNYKPLDVAGTKEAVLMLLPVTTKTDITIKNYRDEQSIIPWYSKIIFNSFHPQDLLEILQAIHAADPAVDFNSKNDMNADNLLRRIISYTSVYIYLNKKYSKLGQETCEYYQNSVPVYLQVIDFLLTHGADSNLKIGSSTVLHQLMRDTVHYDEIKVDSFAECQVIFDKCLQHGFKIDTPNEDGKTLLHMAAERSNLQALQYLLAHGANANCKDKDGRTALHYLAAGNFTNTWTHETSQMIDELRKHGAKTEIIDMHGQTPGILLNVESRKCTRPLQKDEADAIALTKAMLRHNFSINGMFAGRKREPAAFAAKAETPKLK